jgi:hypothetical protein
MLLAEKCIIPELVCHYADVLHDAAVYDHTPYAGTLDPVLDELDHLVYLDPLIWVIIPLLELGKLYPVCHVGPVYTGPVYGDLLPGPSYAV